MLKVENIDVYGFKPAIRGMRNPMNSWEKSDSGTCGDFIKKYENGEAGCDHRCPKWSEENYCGHCEHLEKFPYDWYMVGKNDLDLMRRLYKGGIEHRKFMRMIVVYMDITAPLYWWKEFDTYKVGTVANSCSTMHKIHSRELTMDDFSTDHLTPFSLRSLEETIIRMNVARDFFIQNKDKNAWWQMIQLLPSSYNQKRTVMLNYEVAVNIIRQRTGHKLDEWHVLVDTLKDLPYLEDIIKDE